MLWSLLLVPDCQLRVACVFWYGFTGIESMLELCWVLLFAEKVPGCGFFESAAL